MDGSRSDLSESASPSAPPALPSQSRPGRPEAASPKRDPEGRNFLVMVAYQVLIRTGWIFKTESIIMPAVLDTLGGGAGLRGWLPLLNRFGQGVPPLLMARQVKLAPYKKRTAATTTLLMALVFLLLAGVWRTGEWLGLELTARAWMPVLFLVLYGMFFMANGVNQLCVTTVQGKLIRAERRGRLLLVSNVVGAGTAILCAWWLMPQWLWAEGGNFGAIFGFTGICFLVAAAAMLGLAEPADNDQQPSTSLASLFASAWRALQQDANFRRLAIIAALFSTSIMLFPHYQALGLDQRVGLDLSHLVWWAIVQNAGTALFSVLAGPLADRRGNRLVLRLVMLGICAAPLAAITLSHLGPAGRDLFAWVFVLVGMTPVAIRILSNYTLEIAPPAEHPRYVSTLSLCLAVPIFLSPLVGLLVGLVGFDLVFLAITALVLSGWILTFTLDEPRQRANR